jgi:hypothetical protein
VKKIDLLLFYLVKLRSLRALACKKKEKNRFKEENEKDKKI